MAKTNKTSKIVAEVCYYGTAEVGYDYLICVNGYSLLPNGYSPPVLRFGCAMDALYHAEQDLLAFGKASGFGCEYGALVLHIAPEGLFQATRKLGSTGYWGDLKWEPTAYAKAQRQEEVR